MLGHYWPCVALFRCVIPFILGMCIIFRPCLFSGVYLLFLLWAPFVPVPTKESMSGHTGIYIKLLLSSSVIITVVQLAFQIVLLSLPPYGNILLKCEFLELLLRQIGLVQWNRLSVHITGNWIIPDAVMLPCSILFLIVFQKLVAESAGLHLVEAAVIQDQLKTKKKILTFFASIGRYGVLITLCVASVLMPCVQGALYFLVFLGAATWWACYKQLSKGFAIVQCILLPVVLLHIIAIYVYQFNFVRNFVNDDNPYTRYFGLMLLRTTLCAEDVDPREFVWYWREWPQWANPIVLYWLYTVLVLEAKALLNPELQKKQGPFSRLDGSYKNQLGRHMSQRASKKDPVNIAAKNKWQSATRKVREEVQEEREVMQRADESTPLLGGVGSSRNARRFGSGKKSTIIQDSTGSVTVTGENMEDIPLDDFDEPHYEPTLFEKLAYALEATLQWIIKVSYLGTNIIMMAWSITYLSWLTFVLLLWANLIWAVPNQRRAMLFSSPFLVAYAWFLLLSAYVYSMDLTEAELPSKVQGINLAQIGFEKNLSYGYLPLIVKCLYTTMFWVTLRQYMQERVIKKQSSALADMVAPLQVTVGAATTGQPQPQPSKPGTMEKIGIHLRQFLTKFWIWIVAITLFAVAITGDRMTLFRVVYMALFLIFVLTFQLSFNVWRRIMFAFWIIVIIYSMIVLIMIYTYQFDNFQRYWRDYLHVSDEQQLDIGLEHFEIKELFVRLVTPTFFVIITVIQLHYFHNDFMKLSDPKNVTIINEDVEDPDKSSLQGGAAVESSEKDDDPTTTTSAEFHLSEVGRATSTRIQHNAESFLKYLHKTINHLFTFLELHMPKIVLLFAMFVCVYDENACYMLVVILIVLGCICGRMIQMITIYASSIIVSLMLLARMMFQVQYINSENWDTNCTYHRQNNKTIVELENDALWFGLRKTERNKSSLPDYVKYNILFILVVTVCSVIQVRQHYYKLSRNKPISRTFFMFPKITRSDADKDLKNMLKYLANYGFYKFGVEVSMMAMVFLIGVRMDIYSVFHSLWLLALFSTSRKTLSKIWVFYVLFTAISIPVQYFMAIGLPPTLCIDYPYDSSEVLRRLQEWAFLINQRFQLPTGKLFCDFLLLLVLSRQWVAFRIEKRYEGKRYAGGSNESIIHRYEEKGFENPIPDFVTYVRSYLDIAKRAVLMSFLWITLALVFLAGTNRVNIFSIGYLIGAFIFLWEGSDIYLRPIPKIIKRWNGLIAYCVITITLKAMLQLVGCVFIEYVPSSSCWLIQMWGVGCVRKFGNIALRAGFTDDEKCHVNKEFIGIAWDGLCFAFLIMQRRIFNSYNFFHMIDEIKATTILASRGAELIEEVRVKRIKEQELEEQTILEKIKLKMDKIKANQEKIEGPTDKQSHVIEKPTLARQSSTSSCASATSQATVTPAGYHTPIDDEEPAPLTPRSSLLHPQAPPSPYSAIMTVSLEGYLEPQRISFSSPPNSELNPRPPSPDDSFPVFSPPPYDEAPPYNEAVSELRSTAARQSSLGPPWMAGTLVTPRQSVISYSARSRLSHHEYSIFSGRPKFRRRQPKTYKQAVRSGDYYMFDELEDDDIDLVPERKEDEKDEEDDNPALSELLNMVMQKDVDTVLRHRRQNTIRRRLTMPYRRRSVRSTRSGPYSAISAPPNVDGKKIAIREEAEPHPGTSKDEDGFSTDEESESEPQKYTLLQRIRRYLIFIWALIESIMTSMTHFFNRYSKDYRYLLNVLKKEKRILKDKTNYNVGLRMGKSQIWQPSGSFNTLMRQSEMTSMQITQNSDYDEKRQNSDDSDTKVMASPLPYSSELERRKASVLTVPEIRIMAPSLERGLDSPCSSSRKTSSAQEMGSYEDEEEEMSQYDQPVVVRMLLAFWYVIISRSEILCYFMVFVYQMRSASFISLPLPLMVLFWGTLTLPRPTKTFWVSLIAYVEVIVLIKCIFQFEILPWNNNKNYIYHAYFPPKIIGVHKQEYYANWDLVLLLLIFFHRMMLKSMGVWSYTSTRVAGLLVDGEYRLEDGQLVPVSSSSHRSSRFDHSASERVESVSERTEKSTDRTDETAQTVKDAKERKSIASGRSEEEEPILSLRSVQINPCDHFPHNIKMAGEKYAEAFRIFVQQLLDPSSRVAADVYTFMFLCDFINFFVLLVGYSSFGNQQGDEGVESYLLEDKVPGPFLFMLIMQFLLIIVDRGIYLRKNILAKVIFQFVQIIVLHIWLFILYPILTEKEFVKVIPPQLYYLVKCFYFLLSAYQIRCGYPSRILGNFCCKDYTIINMYLFKGYMLIPFLFELRTVMDWMWTDTSMTIMDWLKMEDIYAHIYKLKCERMLEDQYPQVRGERKNPRIKYLVGGFLLAVIIGIIWFPLVFFSLQSAVGQPNVPTEAVLEVRIGPYEPIYRMTAQSNNIFQFDNSKFLSMQTAFNYLKKSEDFLANYEPVDVSAIKLSQESANIWIISPPDRQKMLQEVASEQPLYIWLQYKISHEQEFASDKGEVILMPNTTERINLHDMLSGKPSQPVVLPGILPKFLKIRTKGEVEAVSLLEKRKSNLYEDDKYRNISLFLFTSNDTGSVQEWWKIQEDCSDRNFINFLSILPYEDCPNSIIFYTFNEKIFPDTLSFLTGGGIVGLYTTIVLVASRVLRGFFAEQCFKIMFEDLPYVDRILQLCLNVYLVREAREFALEEDLFAKLVFLFRSPETLIKWSRPKEEGEGDDDGDGE